MSVKVDAHVVPGDELFLDFPMPVSQPQSICSTPMRGAPRDKVTLIVRPFDLLKDVNCSEHDLDDLTTSIISLKDNVPDPAVRANALLRLVRAKVHAPMRAIGEALSCAGPGQLAKVRLYNRGPIGV